MTWLLFCDDRTESTGTSSAPWFSWQLQDVCAPERWYIQVFDNAHTPVWEEWICCSAGAYVAYDGPALSSMTRYFWRVSACVDEQIIQSPEHSFLTGILCEKDWCGAEWIEAEAKVSSPLFRRSFSLTRTQTQQAVACICGLGLYELYCNGKKVSENRLIPARTDYAPVQYRNLQYPFSGETRKSALYQTYDLSGLLREGDNTIHVWLGNGFYRQTGRSIEGEFDYGIPALRCCIHCADQLIVSNQRWQYTQSPLLHDDPFIGEVFDARLIPDSQTIWHSAVCTAQKQTVLRPQLCPTDGVWQTLHPKALANGIYDAGVNLTGVVQLTCRGKRGGKVHCYFAEQLQGGVLDFTSTCGYEQADQHQIQHDLYILRGSAVEQYTPRFVCHGFRYVQVLAQEAEIIDVTVLRTGMLVEQTAFLETSVPHINRLFQACVDTVRGNLSCGVLSDCPHRERLGYTGDGQLSADALLTLFNAHAFCRKWVQDLLDAQNMQTGYVPHTVPFTGGGGGPAWGSAVAVVPWRNYLHYGDQHTLRQALPAIRLWLDYLAAHTDANGLVCREEDGSWCLGDWVFPSDRPWDKPQLDQPLKPEFVNTCYYAYCLQLYHSSCRALQLSPEKRYTQALEKTAASIDRAFYRNGGYLEGVQGADAFALMAGIVPEARRGLVRAHLAAYYEARTCVPDTGMFGTMHVLEELSKAGHRDLAWRIVCREEYPGLLYLLTQHGYTTMGETWEGSGSQSHIAFTSVSAWLIHWLAGIRPEEAPCGGPSIVLDPFFPKELHHLHAQAQTPCGAVRVDWQRVGKSISLRAVLPAGLSARINLPGREMIDCPAGQGRTMTFRITNMD